jgi:hypothetical protein
MTEGPKSTINRQLTFVTGWMVFCEQVLRTVRGWWRLKIGLICFLKKPKSQYYSAKVQNCSTNVCVFNNRKTREIEVLVEN